MTRATREDPRLRDVLTLAIAVAGLAACITLIYLAMRAVMDVGGACADGGPYVSAQPCPDGTPGAMLIGVFGLFGFGALGLTAGARMGGYAWLPLLAWTGLFATLGWNFLDYGLMNPPAGQGIEWGYVIPGVMFELMAWVPLVFLVATLRGSGDGIGRSSSTAPITANTLRGPGQPGQPSVTVIDMRPPEVQASHRVEVAGPVRKDQLQAIDALFGAAVADAVADAVAEIPLDPQLRATGSGTAAGDEVEFSEGTQALLDRLERLADMRDRGLLTPEEYETAKDAVMHEIEARS
ncbi:MAG TPA: SHOCT domain-containing protein [Candidatus Limnocylindrales bacterium]